MMAGYTTIATIAKYLIWVAFSLGGQILVIQALALLPEPQQESQKPRRGRLIPAVAWSMR